MATFQLEEFLAKCKTKGAQKMDKINGFNVSNRNNFEVDIKPFGVFYSRKLPSGTTVRISGNKKTVIKHDNLKYEIDQFSSEKRIRKFVRTTQVLFDIDEYRTTPKGTLEKVESLKKILSKILPKNIKEAFAIKAIKGKWVRF